MKTSLLNYIETSGGFIDRNAPIVNLSIVKESNDSEIDKAAIIVEDRPELQDHTPVPSVLVEQNADIKPILHAVSTDHNVTESLKESINNLQTVLVEQNNNQKHLFSLVNELFESVKLHNNSINQRVENLDRLVQETSKILFETTEKLSEISSREINLPAPVVNVLLPEQKKIVKTVDRDSNGLIRKVTEETE